MSGNVSHKGVRYSSSRIITPPIKVFLLVFEEFVILAALGGAVGFAGGYLFERSLPREAVEKAFIILGVYLVGAAISVLRICNVNVMKLMKVED